MEDRGKTAHPPLQPSSGEERFRMLLEHSRDVIWTMTPDGRFTYVSPSIQRQSGFTAEEFLNLPFRKFLVESSAGRVMTEIAGQIAKPPSERPGSLTMELQHYCKDGSTRDIEVIAGWITEGNGDRITGIQGSARDITERKRTEEERIRLVTAVEQAAEGIFLTGTDWIIRYANPAFERMLGYDRGEIIGWHTRLLKSGKHDRLYYRNIRETLARGDVWSGRGVNKKKDGSLLDVEVTFSPVRNDTGRIINYVCIHRDISREIRLEGQLNQARKMEAIGTLAGGIAHDFNNLLMGILGHASLLSMDLNEDHPHQDRFRAIEDLVRSGANLTRQLLGFARGGNYEMKRTDLNEIVEKTSTLFGRTRREITVHRKLGPDLLSVEADRGQVEQVLMNLFVNAWHAMPGGGALYLKTENVFLDEKSVQPYNIPPGPYVKLSVTDTGMGMDEKTKERIFEPFFTTREMGRGSGLGLSIVYGIVRGHQGIIHVYSEKGHGTTFNLYFPSRGGKGVPEPSDTPGPLFHGTGTILVVDDEEGIATVTKGMLENLGYRVLTARSGAEGLEICRSGNPEIDLVLLDMIMPEMGGEETFERLRQIRPDMKVILASGYSLNGKAAGIMAKGCRAFLQKPFTTADLSRTVREALDGKPVS